MLLSQLLAALRIELQDLNEDAYVHSEDDLSRAIRKSLSLMSRLMPLRTMVETTVVREVTGETLTISSDTGTLTYKPIKVDSLSIPSKTLDTDYRVNYLTGVVTEIGSNLPDTTYTVAYELDSQRLDISSLLSDYIKIERMEYPAGESPTAFPTFDIVGDFIVLRSSTISFTEDKHIRLIYLKKWTPATDTIEGNYPSHLNDAVIIGSSGQALIFKAEKYTQAAITAIVAGKTVLDGLSAVAATSAPSIVTEINAAEIALTAATARFAAGVTAIGSMTTPLGNSATALGKITDEIGAGTDSAKKYLQDGDDFINAATRGTRVGEVYAVYANTKLGMAQGYEREGTQYVALALGWEAKGSRESALGNGYVNEALQRLTVVSRLLDKYRLELDSNAISISSYSRQLEQVIRYEAIANQYVATAGRFLASGQSKINEMLIMLGLKIEFPMQKASSD